MFRDDKTFAQPQQHPLPEKVGDNVFARAAEIIEKRGWCQGGIGMHGKRVCAFWAIEFAGGATMAHIRKMNAATGMSIAAWNDAPGRTKEEVIAVLRELSSQSQENTR